MSLSTTRVSAPNLLKRPDPSGAGTRVMAKRAKASRTYRYSSDDDVEILGRNQGSGAARISHSTALPWHAKVAAAASSEIRHRCNYR